MSTITELQNRVKTFCELRDWDQFHPPKDLAIGISTEASELLDLFRFKTDGEIEIKMQDPNFKLKVEHELADIFFMVLRFAQKNNLDLSECLKKKIQVNEEKYPIDKSKGSNKKYNE
jgi:NTP pyrophosphatase (non-canonical NTP hydrolase)